MMNKKLRTSKFRIQHSLFITTMLLACSSAVAQDFVPFVIPARPNPDSLIAYPSSQPTKTDSDHLVAHSGHFYCGKHRVRLWGVNLSFGANLPKHEDAPYIAARLAAAGVNAVRCHHMDTARFDAQKQYARQLLTHVNRYRRLRYADDPAVAIVEITNENSFFMWGSEQTLRTLPPYYANILQSKFNAWLQKRYSSDQKLRKAWSEGAEAMGPNLLANSSFQTSEPATSVPKNWHLEQHSGCKASLSHMRYKGKNALRIDIGKADDTEWHLQLNQRDFAVKAGKYYTVIFDAAADKLRRMSCGVSQAHSPWSNLGLSQQVELTDNWQTFRFGFVAKADDKNARISFSFGGSDVPIYLANVEFRSGGRVGLNKGESIKAGSVALYADSETPARTLDQMRFLAETEKAYFDDMRNFIKNDLRCKALVTGTIVFGPLGLYTQMGMDFIDAHAYWQHPRFPGRPWDSGNWLIDQKPMTDYPAQATLFRLAAERLLGKPFTVSEYNHPAPLDSQAECVPMIASFAAAQDWDGIWLYTYSHSSDGWYRENLNSYFDIDTNPAKWGFMRAGAAIFRHAGISPLTKFSSVTFTESSDILTPLAKLHRKHDRDIVTILYERSGITRENMLETQLTASFDNKGLVGMVDERCPQLDWSVENGKGLYSARSQGAWVYTGHAKRLEKVANGQLSVTKPEFAAVTITPLDKRPLNKSRKILITACGRCENTGMKFSEDRRTVGRNWGNPPVLIEAVEGTLSLNGKWTCQALAPDGLPKYQVAILYKNGRGVLQMAPKYKTMWYLLTRNTKSD